MPLEGETEFPNVELETTSLDFGFIVNETTKRIPLRMRNVGCVPVTYSWFLTDAYSVKDLKSTYSHYSTRYTIGSEAEYLACVKPHRQLSGMFINQMPLKCHVISGAENSETMNSEGSAIPIHKIFDFAPFTGVIEPGALETVYVRFWGVPNSEASAVALCSISQGPEYPVRLIGRQVVIVI